MLLERNPQTLIQSDIGALPGLKWTREDFQNIFQRQKGRKDRMSQHVSPGFHLHNLGEFGLGWKGILWDLLFSRDFQVAVIMPWFLVAWDDSICTDIPCLDIGFASQLTNQVQVPLASRSSVLRSFLAAWALDLGQKAGVQTGLIAQ